MIYVLWINNILSILYYYLFFTDFVYSYGSMTYQCPDGYFLSMFSSAHDGSERFYKFGCTKFSDVHLVSFTNKCNLIKISKNQFLPNYKNNNC